MAAPIHESLRKVHASLNVSDLGRSIAFYQALLGSEPAKVRPDYAKFELAEPPLVLSLIPGRPAAGGNLNHAGLRVRTAEELVEIQHRLEAAGIRTEREDGVECCYARQTKFWVTDPDRALWEIYVFHEDVDEHGHGQVPQPQQIELQSRPAQAPLTWAHRLGEPVPSRIPHDDNSVHEVRLEGSVNASPDGFNPGLAFAEVFRVLRPGGRLGIHGLAGDMSCPRTILTLPGPAAAVQYVPTPAEVTGALAAAGFADIQIEKLSETAYFEVDGVLMRELRIVARKPGHRPKTMAHHAVYLGPLAQVADDFGNVYRRGELTPLNVHDWQVLSTSPARSAFLLLAPREAKVAVCADGRA